MSASDVTPAIRVLLERGQQGLLAGVREAQDLWQEYRNRGPRHDSHGKAHLEACPAKLAAANAIMTDLFPLDEVVA
jgi:hypothetical protein